MTPPYALMRADKSGTETEIKVSDNLRMLLEQRDDRREKSSPKSVYWRVLDLDDGERGEAEWCEGAEDCRGRSPTSSIRVGKGLSIR